MNKIILNTLSSKWILLCFLMISNFSFSIAQSCTAELGGISIGIEGGATHLYATGKYQTPVGAHLIRMYFNYEKDGIIYEEFEDVENHTNAITWEVQHTFNVDLGINETGFEANYKFKLAYIPFDGGAWVWTRAIWCDENSFNSKFLCIENTPCDSNGNSVWTNDCMCECANQATFWIDNDNDGHGNPGGPEIQGCHGEDIPGYAQNNNDCDDGDGDKYLYNEEICDEKDNDCDGGVDEEQGDLMHKLYYRDEDGDSYGDSSNTLSACQAPSGFVEEGGDCNDDPTNYGRHVNPDQDEICWDGYDNDCKPSTSDTDIRYCIQNADIEVGYNVIVKLIETGCLEEWNFQLIGTHQSNNTERYRITVWEDIDMNNDGFPDGPAIYNGNWCDDEFPITGSNGSGFDITIEDKVEVHEILDPQGTPSCGSSNPLQINRNGQFVYSVRVWYTDSNGYLNSKSMAIPQDLAIVSDCTGCDDALCPGESVWDDTCTFCRSPGYDCNNSSCIDGDDSFPLFSFQYHAPSKELFVQAAGLFNSCHGHTLWIKYFDQNNDPVSNGGTSEWLLMGNKSPNFSMVDQGINPYVYETVLQATGAGYQHNPLLDGWTYQYKFFWIHGDENTNPTATTLCGFQDGDDIGWSPRIPFRVSGISPSFIPTAIEVNPSAVEPSDAQWIFDTNTDFRLVNTSQAFDASGNETTNQLTVTWSLNGADVSPVDENGHTFTSLEEPGHYVIVQTVTDGNNTETKSGLIQIVGEYSQGTCDETNNFSSNGCYWYRDSDGDTKGDPNYYLYVLDDNYPIGITDDPSISQTTTYGQLPEIYDLLNFHGVNSDDVVYTYVAHYNWVRDNTDPDDFDACIPPNNPATADLNCSEQATVPPLESLVCPEDYLLIDDPSEAEASNLAQERIDIRQVDLNETKSFTSKVIYIEGKTTFNTSVDKYYRLNTDHIFCIESNAAEEPDQEKSVDVSTLDADFAIYPNPGSNQINLKLSENFGSPRILVLDAKGSNVNFKCSMSGQNTFTIDVNAMEAGVYHILVSEGLYHVVKKFIKIN